MPNPDRENPTEKNAYTVICVINPDSCTLVSHIWAYDANDAVQQAMHRYSGHISWYDYYNRGDIELIGVLLGHAQWMMLEDDFRITWLQHPVIEDIEWAP